MKIAKILLPALFLPTLLFAAPDKLAPHDFDNLSLRNEVGHAIEKGLAWLKTKQDTTGFWDQAEYPALTGLILTAYERDPFPQYKNSDTVKKGYDFVLSCVHPDGGIYKKDELLNYNTSICIMALLADDPAKHEEVLRKARQFLVGQQMTGDPKDNTYAGGIGYGDDDPHSDMSNMVFALEALHETNYLRAKATGEQASAPVEKDLDWNAAINFVQRCQNLSSVNKAKWTSDDPKDKGGFVYTPEESQPDPIKLSNGRTILRSYGSMTYAGMLSYIYAGVDHNDPRVKGAAEWIRNNYSTEENPGVGHEGLYYYYHTFAKTMATYGQDKIKLANGKEIDWRRDLAQKLLNLQHEEGFWVNDNGRHWEKNSVLTTAYTVLALEYVYQSL